MSKMREAWEKHCNGDEEYFDEVSFNAGYQAAIAAVREGGPYIIAPSDTAIGESIKLYKLPEDWHEP